MELKKTEIQGCFQVFHDVNEDQRGNFVTVFENSFFALNELCVEWQSYSYSYNKYKGTIRGLHFQVYPFQQAKLINCTSGSIYDVVIDLRPESSTYLKFQTFELSSEGFFSIYIPQGCAHGFQTLADSTSVRYLLSKNFSESHSSGIRYNDPFFQVQWPMNVSIISKRDTSWSDYEVNQHKTADVNLGFQKK